MATELGLTQQVLILNRIINAISLPAFKGLHQRYFAMPLLNSLQEKQMLSSSVLDLGEESNKVMAFEGQPTVQVHLTQHVCLHKGHISKP